VTVLAPATPFTPSVGVELGRSAHPNLPLTLGNRELIESSRFDLNTFSFRYTDLPTIEIDFLAKRKMPIYDNLRTHEFGGGVADPVE